MADTTFVSKAPPAISQGWLQDLNDLFYRGTKALTVTNLTASVQVTTPVVTTSIAIPLGLGTNNTARWFLQTTANNDDLRPATDGVASLGGTSNRVLTVFSNSVNLSGTGAIVSRSGATNNAVYSDLSNTSGRGIFGVESSAGGGTLLGGGTAFATQAFSVANVPFEVGNNNNIVARFSGGGAGNKFIILSAAAVLPTIDVSAGAGAINIIPNLTITGVLSVAGGSGIGNVGASQWLNLPYNANIAFRNSGNSADLPIVNMGTINARTNIAVLGGTGGIVFRSGMFVAGAPTTSDIASGQWTLWRDTSGATTKLYYNNGGTIQSVALT